MTNNLLLSFCVNKKCWLLRVQALIGMTPITSALYFYPICPSSRWLWTEWQNIWKPKKDTVERKAWS